ncbi:hypothetical protein CHS0354_000774 [Potamilus streckersoni]|uniref:phosphoribosylglycinamide formyltransferase 1 n=1 Tax=Potamilus streckersoni TaxID=2493646 RepID=A0AAE0T7D5_9BIVA|nr:hypothetical protein CHS0354_000774 [Potamilus streckersoni]
MNVKRIAVCCSGGGSNLKALVSYSQIKPLPVTFTLFISDKHGTGAEVFANKCGIRCKILQQRTYTSEACYERAFLDLLRAEHIDIVLLAGYLKRVPSEVVKAYKGRMLNIHPSLLPKFGGAGMYGIHVHEAVAKAKEKITGATVHFVDEEFDTGKILLQAQIHLNGTESPEEIARKVLDLEHKLYPAALEQLISSMH